uniref:C-SKI SMAD4-binding domain-containing protein n=1 Tax=Globodera rostochiensis TaxID=31243 RepID=A0A914GX12_GLORO
MLNQTPASSSSTAVTYETNLSIDERDVVMKNLHKLLKSHNREQLGGEHKQPGCSRQADVDSQTPEALAERACQPLPSKLPFAIACDGNYSALKSTIVNNKLLGCFVIGGECRLCFPQVRALCLGEISTQQIDEAMQFLAIANALASEEQLIELKRAGLAHPSLSKCELITKTNAERLISVLHSGGTPPMDDSQRSQLLSLKVVHDCFGGCSAFLYPDLSPTPCFECRTCYRMFKPEDFCRHTHQPTSDKNICFWGFDASNWAYYIRVDDSEAMPTEEDEQRFVIFIQGYPNHQI